MRIYAGGCHCGQVRFEVTTDLARVTACNCSICTQKGYLHLIVPPERFRLLAGEAALQTYRFGTMTAKHHFCRHCGVASFYVPRSHPDMIDVNARLPRRRRPDDPGRRPVRPPQLGDEHRRPQSMRRRMSRKECSG